MELTTGDYGSKEKKRNIQVIPFRKKVIFLYTGICVLLFGFCFFDFYKSYKQYSNDAFYTIQNNCEIIASDLNKLFSTIESYTASQLSSEPFKSIISEQIKSDQVELLNKIDEKNTIQYNTPTFPFTIMSSYFFVDENTFYRFPISIINNEKEMVQVYKESQKDLSSGPHLYRAKDNGIYIYYVRNVNNLPTKKAQGTIIQCFTYSTLTYDNSISELPDDLEILITDSEGIIYYAHDWNVIGQECSYPVKESKYIKTVFINDKDDLVYISHTLNNRLYVVCSIPNNIILKQVFNRIIPTDLFVLGFALLLLVIITFFLMKLVKYTNTLTDGFKEIGQGNYSVRLQTSRDSDIALINDGFNSMAEKTEQMIFRVRQEEALRKESEIRFLQAQINPHFLFNVLTSIRLNAKLAGNEKVYNMLLALGELMYAGITNNDTPMIPLKTELHYVEQYLYLQSIRFVDRLSFNINIQSDDLLDTMIPQLSIESIVENAVIHGLENKIGKGNIVINIGKESRSDEIVISVIDDGIGFDTSMVSENSDSKPHSGVGLRNVNKRLQLIFGESYGLDVQSTIGEGTCVIMHIPHEDKMFYE